LTDEITKPQTILHLNSLVFFLVSQKVKPSLTGIMSGFAMVQEFLQTVTSKLSRGIVLDALIIIGVLIILMKTFEIIRASSEHVRQFLGFACSWVICMMIWNLLPRPSTSSFMPSYTQAAGQMAEEAAKFFEAKTPPPSFTNPTSEQSVPSMGSWILRKLFE
jgi:hypothetical protein